MSMYVSIGVDKIDTLSRRGEHAFAYSNRPDRYGWLSHLRSSGHPPSQYEPPPTPPHRQAAPRIRRPARLLQALRTSRQDAQGSQMRKRVIRSDWIGKQTHSTAQLLPHSGNAQTIHAVAHASSQLSTTKECARESWLWGSAPWTSTSVPAGVGTTIKSPAATPAGHSTSMTPLPPSSPCPA